MHHMYTFRTLTNDQSEYCTIFLYPGTSGDRGETAEFANRPDKEIPKDKPTITGKNTFAAPRSVVKPLGWTQKDEKSDVGAEELKSNEEFRNLLLKK